MDASLGGAGDEARGTPWMSGAVIRASRLGKRYRIGGPQERYRTLRDAMSEIVRSPGRLLRRATRADPYVWALRDVDLQVRDGEVVGLIGRNGAGKSTLLKILSRITEPTEGNAELHGRVGSLLEIGTGFHPELTGRENVLLSGAVLGMSRQEVRETFDDIVDFAEVAPFIETPVKHYSSGMYLRLAFAVAAHLEPEILLVDEVLAVGDARFRRKCLGRMSDLGRSGRAVIFVSHDMTSIRQLCDRVIWLDGGRIYREGPAAEITVAYEGAALELADLRQRNVREPVDFQGKECWFAAIELRDGSDALTTEFEHGDVLRLVMELGGTPPRDDFTIEWLLFNERGDRVSSGNANPMQDVYFDRSVRKVACDIGPLWLTSGSYRLWLSMRVWNQPPRWDTWEDAATFRVPICDPYNTGFDCSAQGAGVFVMPQRWQVLDRLTPEPSGRL